MATPGEFKKLPTPYRIGLTMYEADDPLKNLPQWRHDCADADMLIVPSEYCKNVFAQFVKTPIAVSPLATNPLYNVRLRREPRDTFTFITFGTLTGRKAPLETMAAFQAAFPIDKYPDVHFEFKTRLGYFGWGEGQLAPIPDPRVKVINGDWYPQQVLDWMLQADAMVFMSKGEGFGMPPREAMATGLPTIVANHTGLIPICNEQYTWPIPVKGVEDSPLGGNWRIPDWDALIETMRWVYHNREVAYQKGYNASEWFIQTQGEAAVEEY